MCHWERNWKEEKGGKKRDKKEENKLNGRGESWISIQKETGEN